MPHDHKAAGLSQKAAVDGSHHTRSTPDGSGERVDFPINGMSCAACARRVEQGLSRAPGVRKASVNFATNKATVEYDPKQTGVRALLNVVRVEYLPSMTDAATIRRALASFGYRVRETPANSTEAAAEDSEQAARQAEYRDLRTKFWIAAILSLPVLIIAMSHGRIEFLNFEGVNWIQLALTTPVVFYCGCPARRCRWTASSRTAHRPWTSRC